MALSLSISTSKRLERYLRASFSQLDSMSASLPWSRSRKGVCYSVVESKHGVLSDADNECRTRTKVESARGLRVASSQGPALRRQRHGPNQRCICRGL